MYQADEPSAVFHVLHHTHKRRVMEAQGARGLGDLGSPMLLMTLFRGEHLGEQYSQRDLARLLRLSPATVAVALKPMERNGYVERSTDERDARRNRVSLTDKGRRAVELCGEAFQAVDRQMLSGFTPGERAALSGFLARMIENLGGADDLPCPPPPPPAKEEL